jgi:hypothetical protein
MALGAGLHTLDRRAVWGGVSLKTCGERKALHHKHQQHLIQYLFMAVLLLFIHAQQVQTRDQEWSALFARSSVAKNQS